MSAPGGSVSARPQERHLAGLQRRTMDARDVDAVQAIEASAYAFPWSRGNFIDSLAAGYLAEVIETRDGLLGYFLAMPGVDELHLLNVTVAPAHQNQGWGQQLLDVVQEHGRRLGLSSLLLEVRQSNERARALYQRRGFAVIGLRRGYYPALQGREDAVVMSLVLADTRGAPHGLV
jgi:ribosomal-protein-alanine N-acetyltransferase